MNNNRTTFAIIIIILYNMNQLLIEDAVIIVFFLAQQNEVSILINRQVAYRYAILLSTTFAFKLFYENTQQTLSTQSP